MAEIAARADSARARMLEHRIAPLLDRSSAGGVRHVKTLSRPGRVVGAWRKVPPGTKSLLTLAIVAIVALYAIAVSVSLVPADKDARTQAYTLHQPIFINGDGGFTSANGVVGGTGAEGNPFIISGWEIRVQMGNGITITGTTARFIISDVHVNSTASASGVQHAIYLYNVTNGEVKTSLLNNTPTGIHIELATDSSIHHNQIRSNSLTAVELFTCDRVNVVGNTILAANGVRGTAWTNSVVELNRIDNSENAIQLTDAANMVVQQNTLVSCTYAVMVTQGTGIVVTGNNASLGYYGVYLWNCWGVNVSGNDILRSLASGFSTSEPASNVTFIYNKIRNSMYAGYFVESADGIVVTENLFENNTYGFAHVGGGVTITSAINMTFFLNNFVTNTPAQVEDPTGPANRWNETYPIGGNYWSDYAGTDDRRGPSQDQPGKDGFGDTAYVIDSDSWSYYPLMVPYYINSKPVALFTVTPPAADTGTTITFDASSSYDPDEGVGDTIQKYRWDFDGDGNWDTGWSSGDTTNHQYLVPGNYTAILEVSDSHGLASLHDVQITISGTVIPEFGTVLVPVLGLLAVVGCAVMVSRRNPGSA